MKPARRVYIVTRSKHKKILCVQARINGRASPFWLMTDPIIVSIDCPACNAPAWHHCIRPNGQPKARPHDQRLDAYADAVRRGSVPTWQSLLHSSHSLSL